MADKSFGIIVTGDISDIEDKLSSLSDTISGLVDKVLNIGVEIDDSQLEGLDTEIQTLDNQTLNETVDVEASELDSVESDLEQLDGQVLQETVEVNDQGVEDAKINLEEMGAAGDTASTQIQTSIDGAINKVGELGDKSTDTAQKTEVIGTKAAESGDKAEIGMATAALAVLGLVAALDMASKSVQDLNIYFDKVASNEIPEEEWRKFFAEITNAKFPIDEARTYVTLLKQMGVTSEDSLMRGATAMNDMRIATGSSVESMKKFASSIAVMGIDLNNLPSAFNAVAYAQANVIGGFEAYVQWMQKYDATFREMGLSIDQTAIIIAAATKKWGGGRAAYQGLNEALKESGGNLDVLEEKLGLHNDELDHATELTAQYSGKIEKNSDIVRDNTTASERAGDAWNDLNIILGDLIANIADYGWQLLQLGAIVGLVIPGILKWFDQLWGTDYSTKYTQILGKIGIKIKDFGVNVGKTVKSWMSWGDDAGRAAGRIGTEIEGGIEKPSIWTKFKDFGTRVRGFITKDWSIWGDDAGRVTVDMVKGMDGIWAQKSPGFLEKIARFGRSVPTVLSDAISKVGIKLPSLEGAGSTLGSTFLKGLSKLAIPLTVAQLFLEGIYNFEENLKKDPLDVILDTYWLRPLYDLAVPEPVRKFIDDLTSYLAPENLGPAIFGEGYTEFAQWLIDNVSNPLHDWVDNLWPNIQSTFAGIGQIDLLGTLFGTGGVGAGGLYDNIVSTFTSIVSFLSTIPGQIASVFTLEGFNAIIDGALFSIGSFAKTLYELPGNIMIALQGVYDTLVYHFNNALLYLQTLPEQFMTWASNIWLSLVNGFNSVIESVKNAINNVPNAINDLINWFKNLPGNLYNLARDAWNGIVNGFNSMIQSIKSAVDNAMKKIDEGIQYIKDLPGKMWEWGSNTIKSWVDGLKNWVNSNWEGFKGWLNDRLKHLWDGWESHSPPKALPDIDKWGANLAKTYLESVASGIEKGKSLIDSSLAPLKDSFNIGLTSDIGNLSGFSMPRATMDTISNSTNEMKTEVSFGDIKVDVDRLDVTSPEAAEEGAELLFSKFMEKLKKEYGVELAQKGINLYRSR